MPGLEESRWAKSTSSFAVSRSQYHPPVSTQTPPTNLQSTSTNASLLQAPENRLTQVQRRRISQLQDHSKFHKLLPRLKWKSTTLLHSHQRAILGQTDNYIDGTNFSIGFDDNAHNNMGRVNAADSMFKLDFYEFYVLLERVLVHLLGALGVIINAEHAVYDVPLPPTRLQRDGDQDVNTLPTTAAGNSLIGDSRVFHGYAHRFHANVLEALDQEANPVHQILGTGEVREYLGLAKEVRNKWKNVDDYDTGGGEQDDLTTVRKRYHQILQDLKLDRLLATILRALDQAKVVVAQEILREEEAWYNKDREVNINSGYTMEYELSPASSNTQAAQMEDDLMDYDFIV